MSVSNRLKSINDLNVHMPPDVPLQAILHLRPQQGKGLGEHRVSLIREGTDPVCTEVACKVLAQCPDTDGNFLTRSWIAFCSLQIVGEVFIESGQVTRAKTVCLRIAKDLVPSKIKEILTGKVMQKQIQECSTVWTQEELEREAFFRSRQVYLLQPSSLRGDIFDLSWRRTAEKVHSLGLFAKSEKIHWHSRETGEQLLFSDKKESQLAEGAYGTVFVGVQIDLSGTRAEVVIKRRKAGMHNEEVSPFICSMLRNQPGTLVPFIWFCSNVEHCCIEKVEVTPRYERNLRRVIQDVVPLSLDGKLNVAKQILQAVYRAQEIGILHLDIKPENIVVKKDPKREGFLQVCLIDWDSAVLLKGMDSVSKQLCGSVVYLAPEIILCKRSFPHFSLTNDWWAVGLILWELFDQRLPESLDKAIALLPSNDDVKRQLEKIYLPDGSHVRWLQRERERLSKGNSRTDVIKQAICGLLHLDPKHRLSVQQVLTQLDLIQDKK